MGRGPKPTKGKAKPAVSRQPPKSDHARVRDLEKRLAESLEREKATGELLQEKNRALTEALEQQTATADILRVISRSPTDIQAALATVAERAARLCDSFDAVIFRVDGDTLRRVAHHGPIPPTGSTTPLVRGFVNGRVVLERRGIYPAGSRAGGGRIPEGEVE